MGALDSGLRAVPLGAVGCCFPREGREGEPKAWFEPRQPEPVPTLWAASISVVDRGRHFIPMAQDQVQEMRSLEKTDGGSVGHCGPWGKGSSTRLGGVEEDFLEEELSTLRAEGLSS